MLFVFVHSPLVGPSTWSPCVDLLAASGLTGVVPDLRPALDEGPPFWPAVLRQAASLPFAGSDETVIVGHSGAGAFLPLIAARLSARAVVFVDAVVPPEHGEYAPSPEFAAFVERQRLVQPDDRLAPWTTWWGPGALAELVPDPELRARIVDEIPRVPRSFYAESIPVPDGWSRRPSAYLQLSPAYDAETERVARLGWPLERLAGRHLAAATRPREVLDAIERLLASVVPGS